MQRNKAIVGQNAFAHEAGIHQDGMLKERTTYEIMRPEDVGFATTDLVLGKHSGRAALANRAKALGYTLTSEQLQTVFEQFKVLADKKKEIYDADIAALIEQEIRSVSELWSLLSYQVTAGTGKVPVVTLRLRRGEEEFSTEMACGDGPVDAVFLAIEELTGITVDLPRLQRPQRHGGQGRAGRGGRRGGARGPVVSRPGRIDRQRRGQRQGVSGGDQPHRRQRRRSRARRRGSGVA